MIPQQGKKMIHSLYCLQKCRISWQYENNGVFMYFKTNAYLQAWILALPDSDAVINTLQHMKASGTCD